MYAIIEDSGHQHKITTGDTIHITRDLGENETTVTFDRVLLIGGEGDPKIGAPLLSGATVTADVVKVGREPKVFTVKYKRRKGFHKRTGHRQPFVAVKITGINV